MKFVSCYFSLVNEEKKRFVFVTRVHSLALLFNHIRWRTQYTISLSYSYTYNCTKMRVCDNNDDVNNNEDDNENGNFSMYSYADMTNMWNDLIYRVYSYCFHRLVIINVIWFPAFFLLFSSRSLSPPPPPLFVCIYLDMEKIALAANVHTRTLIHETFSPFSQLHVGWFSRLALPLS